MVHQLTANIFINNIDCSLLKHAAKWSKAATLLPS